MSNETEPRIVSADRLGGGVLISFEDGRSAIYPAALLYDLLAQAKEINEEEDEE